MAEERLTKTQKRLLQLFKDIEDEDVRTIVTEVVVIEASNRSSHAFPIRKVKDIVDSAAQKQEIDIRKEG